MKHHSQFVLRATLCVVTGVAAAQVTRAQNCRTSGAFRVCADWSAAGDPSHPTDFAVTFNGASPPNVQLNTGDAGWVIYVQHTSDNSPADLNTLQTTANHNFGVLLRGPSNTPGADDVSVIDLDPSGDFQASLLSGSLVAGDIGTVELYPDGSGAGGELNLIVNGDAGIIVVQDVGNLYILGDLIGEITVNDSVAGTILTSHAVADDVPITITTLAANADLIFGFDGDPGDTFGGHLTLKSDIAGGSQVVIGVPATDDAEIDLDGHDVAGTLRLNEGTGDDTLIHNIDTLSGIFQPNVSFGGSFDGLAIIESVASSGAIWNTDSDLAGDIEITGDLAGVILTQGGGLVGGIEIGGDCTATSMIVIEEDMEGEIVVGDDMLGEIRIWGSFLDSTEGLEIEIVGSFGSTGAFTVDWEGWHPNHSWDPDAVISVDQNVISENTPAARAWEVSECKGDMDNDGDLDNDDKVVFFMAQADPGDFAEAFPGLTGALLYKADFVGDEEDECDEEIDYFDGEPFITAVEEQCCLHDCEESCESFGPGGGATPQKVAEAIETYADPGWIATLIELIQQLGVETPQARREFWEAVATILQE